MDVFHRVTSPFKMLSHNNGIQAWCSIVEEEGVVVCRNLGPALKIIGHSQPSCDVLRGSYSLGCNVGDLKAWIEIKQGADWEAYEAKGCIEKPGCWRWILTGEPFDMSCCNLREARCAMSCWQKKLQKIDSINASTNETIFVPAFTLRDMQAGLWFGVLKKDGEYV